MNEKLKECYNLVIRHYNNDMEKTGLWFAESNQKFNGYSPNQLIINGEISKVKEFIETQLKESKDLV